VAPPSPPSSSASATTATGYWNNEAWRNERRNLAGRNARKSTARQKRLIGALVSISDWLFGSLPAEQVLDYIYALIRIQSESLNVEIEVRLRVRSKD